MTRATKTAVINPTTPTITVEVSGVICAAIPAESSTSDPSIPNDCPQWAGGHIHIKLKRDGIARPSRTYSNYPTFYTSAYSTEGLLNNYVGVKAYSFSAGDNPIFTGGVSESSAALLQPQNLRPFGIYNYYTTHGIIPSARSSLADPEGMILVSRDVNVYDEAYSGGYKKIYQWAGWKFKPGVAPELVGLFTGSQFDPAPLSAQDSAGRGYRFWGGIASDDYYYILRNSDDNLYPSNTTPVLSIVTETTFPADFSHGLHYNCNFSDANLPVDAGELFNFYQTLNSTSQSYLIIACHPTELGFLISYKEEIAGSWYPKFLLVDKDWLTFQWVTFTAGNTLAGDIIAQSTLNPYATSSTWDRTSAVSAFYKNGIWYLLGGSNTTPIVATNIPDDYGIVTIGSTLDDEQGFFYHSPYSDEPITGLIDGAFFGCIDVPFFNTDIPDDCTDLVVVAQRFNSETLLVGIILRCDDGIWRVTAVSDDNKTMTLELLEAPKRLIHETNDG